LEELSMKTTMLSALAGAVFLASGAVASAGEPVKLGLAELDSVTAGTPGFVLELGRTTIAAVSQSSSQRNVVRNVRVRQSAYASSGLGSASASNTGTLSISQSNSATQTNSGSASASN
jgi:hypothetical protein